MIDDDEDPLSLDFTKASPAPAVVSTVPEPPPKVVAPPPAPVPAVTVPPSTWMPPAALVEAANLHAAGKDIEASRRLETAIKSGEPLGESADKAWRALFELMQELGNAAAFDKLALAYARRFELSPPTWNAVPEADNHVDASSGGRAHVALVGTLDARIGETLKQMMKLAQTAPLVRIDMGKLTAADNDGATLLMRALAALKKARREYVFGNPSRLAGILAALLEPGQRVNEAAWLLLLELYQQAWDQAAFEEAAVNYAVTFEVSPPSFVSAASGRPSPLAVKPPPVRDAGDFSLEGQMIGAGADAFAGLDRIAAERGEIDIDGLGLRRIDAASTEQLKQALARVAAKGCRVRILGLSELIAAWLHSHGFAEIATLRARKA